MIPERGRQALLTVLGLGAGVATGVWLWRRQTGRESYQPAGPWTRPESPARDVADRLRRDGRLARSRIEVDGIAEGVVELTGEVEDRSASERAVGIAQATTGVYTVVNRLRIEDEDARREATRRRWNDGAPDLRERHHYGMGVGMGTRRQSPATDPDRPSDKQRLLERELDVAKVEDLPEPSSNSASAPGSPEGEGEAGTDVAVGGGSVEVGDEAGGEEGRP